MKPTAIVAAMLLIFAALSVASAGTSVQTFVGDGNYQTSWNGDHGVMVIDTYTSNGRDLLAVDYRRGGTFGNQNGATGAVTTVDRSVVTYGRNTAITAVTWDNSGDLVAINAAARRGSANLDQTAYLVDGANVDAVVSIHNVNAGGRKYSTSVHTQAGDAITKVSIFGRHGGANINGIAAAGSGYGIAASGQIVNANAYTYCGCGNGVANIGASGDSVGVGGFYPPAMMINNDGTTYYTNAHGMTMINLNDQFNHNYHATGYIYSISQSVV